jgi:hypothetical protein
MTDKRLRELQDKVFGVGKELNYDECKEVLTALAASREANWKVLQWFMDTFAIPSPAATALRRILQRQFVEPIKQDAI